MKLKQKMVIILSVIFITGFASLIIFSYQYSKQNTIELTNKRQMDIVASTQKYINDFIASKFSTINSLADTLSKLPSRDVALVHSYLTLAKNSSSITTYVGYENDGQMLTTDGEDSMPADGYDPRVRPWHTDAKNSKTIGVTSPYLDHTTKKMAITVYQVMQKDGSIIGVAGGDLFLDDIVKTVLNVNLDNNGYAFLIGKDGNLIADPDSELIGNKSVV